MISKDMAIFSQQLQCIMLCIHQYSVHILYKPGPELDIVDWLSCHNHIENWDQEIPGMNVSIHKTIMSVDIPVCTSIEDIQAATEEDPKLQMLWRYITIGWPLNREMVEPRLKLLISMA